MANPEHVRVLKQGVEAWNRWRSTNIAVYPDLSDIDLRTTAASWNLPQFIDLAAIDNGGPNFRNTNLTRSNFADAYLPGADFARATLCYAHLNGATLYGANFASANLLHCDLRFTQLQATRFADTNLSEADLSFAQLLSTSFAACNLTKVRGLEFCAHDGPSSVDYATLLTSQDIPSFFLRGCGVPDTLITYLDSLRGVALDFYTCFISYSSKNDAFAQRLYADLQANGVRCWFAPEDLRTGDKFRTRIDEAIRVRDKLLIVLSENSIKSAWVEKEVESAFEEERRRGETVLFPIRLDDAVLTETAGWAADIRRTRHIADFTRWRDHDAYQAAFKRLLRDLKQEKPALPR